MVAAIGVAVGRKTSATSKAGAAMEPGQSGGVISSDSRSKGLWVVAIRRVETCV